MPSKSDQVKSHISVRSERVMRNVEGGGVEVDGKDGITEVLHSCTRPIRA